MSWVVVLNTYFIINVLIFFLETLFIHTFENMKQSGEIVFYMTDDEIDEFSYISETVKENKMIFSLSCLLFGIVIWFIGFLLLKNRRG